MKVGEAIAEIMKREGIEILTGYPVNHLIEFAAARDIRPVMVRQERIGLHMAGCDLARDVRPQGSAPCMQTAGDRERHGGVARSTANRCPCS